MHDDTSSVSTTLPSHKQANKQREEKQHAPVEGHDAVLLGAAPHHDAAALEGAALAAAEREVPAAARARLPQLLRVELDPLRGGGLRLQALDLPVERPPERGQRPGEAQL